MGFLSNTNTFVRNHLDHITTPICKYRWLYLYRKRWSTVFLLPVKHIIPNRIKDFPLKILQRYYPVKDKIQQMLFCDYEGEMIEHVYTDCVHSTAFWLDLQKYLSEMLKKRCHSNKDKYFTNF